MNPIELIENLSDEEVGLKMWLRLIRINSHRVGLIFNRFASNKVENFLELAQNSLDWILNRKLYQGLLFVIDFQ